jgi:hypothetical protein
MKRLSVFFVAAPAFAGTPEASANMMPAGFIAVFVLAAVFILVVIGWFIAIFRQAAEEDKREAAHIERMRFAAEMLKQAQKLPPDVAQAQARAEERRWREGAGK